MSTRARLYLDVDGVLNCFGWHKLWGQMQEGYATADGYEFMIQWAPAQIDALRALDVDLVWTTTWRDNAVKSLAPLIGWGGHGRVLHPYMNSHGESTFPSIDWKRDTIIMDQRRDPSPFLWLDDEISPLELYTADRLDGLAIATDPQFGIVPRQISQMQNYLDLVNERV